MDTTELDRRFDHHAPGDDETVQQHEYMRTVFKSTARTLDIDLPDGREKALALTKLEEAHFWAHAAIARGPMDLPSSVPLSNG